MLLWVELGFRGAKTEYSELYIVLSIGRGHASEASVPGMTYADTILQLLEY